MADHSYGATQRGAVSLDAESGEPLSSEKPLSKDDLLAVLLKMGRGQPGWLYAIAQSDEVCDTLKAANLSRQGGATRSNPCKLGPNASLKNVSAIALANTRLG